MRQTTRGCFHHVQCLGVFAGGFGLEAAQRVAAAEGLDEWAVLDHLGALVDKSLVVVEPDAAGGLGPRYALLESARAFALERLEEAGRTPATARRHALAVLDAFERSVAQVWTTPMDALLPRVLADIDNLRAALEWAAGEDATTLTALAGASWWLWKPALVPAEGLRWCETAIGRIDATTPPGLEARLRYGYANLSHLSAAERELAALRRAAELYGEIGDRQGAYLALTRLAQKLAWRYDLSAAAQAAQEAAVLWDADWPPAMREDLLLARTYVLEASGRAAEGQPLMEELVALMRGLGDARKLDVALIQFAENLVVQGKDGQAIEVRREVAERVADRRVDYAGTNLANLSAALTFHDELDEALRVAREALPMLRRENRIAPFLDHFALLACKRGRAAAAARVLGRADADYRRSGFGRELSEQRAFDLVLPLLQRTLPASALEALRQEGAALSDEDAVRAALDEASHEGTAHR